jgi:hypothetical protein
MAKLSEFGTFGRYVDWAVRGCWMARAPASKHFVSLALADVDQDQRLARYEWFRWVFRDDLPHPVSLRSRFCQRSCQAVAGPQM